jgi:hypothetical protein
MAGPCRPLVPSQNTTASYPSAILAVHLYLSLTFLHKWPIKVLFHSWFGATAKRAARDGIDLISVSIYQRDVSNHSGESRSRIVANGLLESMEV